MNYTKKKMDVKPGDKIGLMTLIKEFTRKLPHGATRIFYECLCDCGKTFCRQRSYCLKIANEDLGRISSCGCQHPLRHKKGKKNKGWTGHEDISGSYFAGFLCKCKKSGMEFDITKEQLWEKFLQQDRKCAYTGIELYFQVSKKEANSSIQTASLDRIDSSKGYVIGNFQWVHKDINLMKNHFDESHFVEMCRKVGEKHPRPQAKLGGWPEFSYDGLI